MPAPGALICRAPTSLPLAGGRRSFGGSWKFQEQLLTPMAVATSEEGIPESGKFTRSQQWQRTTWNESVVAGCPVAQRASVRGGKPKVRVLVAQSCLTLCDPARPLCPWDSPWTRQEHWSGWPLLQGIFLTQGSNPGLLHCRRIPYHLSHPGSQIRELTCVIIITDTYVCAEQPSRARGLCLHGDSAGQLILFYVMVTQTGRWKMSWRAWCVGNSAQSCATRSWFWLGHDSTPWLWVTHSALPGHLFPHLY